MLCCQIRISDFEFTNLAVWSWLVVVASLFGPEARGAGPQVPAALAWGRDGLLRVALRDGRAVATVDPRSWTVVSRQRLPVRPVSIARADDEDTFLVGSTDGHLVVLGAGGQVVSDLAVGRGPTQVVPLPGGRAAVAACWDPVLRVVDARLRQVVAEHSLGFPPGALVHRPDGRIVVADAFGGRLCALVPGRAGSERTCAIEATGIHALAISGDGKELLLAFMEQDDALPITTANIDAGRILSAQLGAIRLSDLDRPQHQVPIRKLTLDGPVHGAADPSGMAVSRDGTKVVIALAGAHQIVSSDRSEGASRGGARADDLLPLGHNQRLAVVEVGRSPLAVTLVEHRDPGELLAVAADAMSDTLTVIRLADRARVATVALGPPRPERSAAQRGEAVFRDGRRSHDRWMSCASCHPGGHTTGLNFDTFGDSGFGAPKNTPTLLGIAGTHPFTWTAKFDPLAGQVHQSFATSLHGPEPEPGVVEDLVTYLESLAPAPPRRRSEDPAAIRGALVFTERRCQTCHEPPLYTIAATRDVGLDDGSGGHRRFNPPSLRGVAWTAPYLHDGRAATLADVLQVHLPGKTDPLTPQDRDDLIAFLESL
jgi:mono/diheme cytochrome c family protein